MTFCFWLTINTAVDMTGVATAARGEGDINCNTNSQSVYVHAPQWANALTDILVSFRSNITLTPGEKFQPNERKKQWGEWAKVPLIVLTLQMPLNSTFRRGKEGSKLSLQWQILIGNPYLYCWPSLIVVEHSRRQWKWIEITQAVYVLKTAKWIWEVRPTRNRFYRFCPASLLGEYRVGYLN